MKIFSGLLAVLALSVFAPGIAPSAHARDGVSVQIGPNGFGISVDKYRNKCRNYYFRQNNRNYCGYDRYDNRSRYRYNQNRYYHQDQYNQYYRKQEGRDWNNRRRQWR